MSQPTPYRIATNNSSGGGTSTTAQMSFAQRVNTDIATNLNGAGITVPIDGTLTTLGANWAINGNGIQYTGTDPVFVRCSFSVHVGASVNRANMLLRCELNGTTPFGPIAAHGYIRNASGHNESSYSMPGTWIQLNQNDIVTIVSTQEAGGGNVSMDTAGTSQLLLERIDNV